MSSVPPTCRAIRSVSMMRSADRVGEGGLQPQRARVEVTRCREIPGECGEGGTQRARRRRREAATASGSDMPDSHRRDEQVADVRPQRPARASEPAGSSAQPHGGRRRPDERGDERDGREGGDEPRDGGREHGTAGGEDEQATRRGVREAGRLQHPGDPARGARRRRRRPRRPEPRGQGQEHPRGERRAPHDRHLRAHTVSVCDGAVGDAARGRDHLRHEAPAVGTPPAVHDEVDGRGDRGDDEPGVDVPSGQQRQRGELPQRLRAPSSRAGSRHPGRPC